VLGEAGVDQYGVVGADVQVEGERVVCEVEGAGAVEEVAPDPVGGGVLVVGELAGEEPVEVAGDHGQGGVREGVRLAAPDVRDLLSALTGSAARRTSLMRLRRRGTRCATGSGRGQAGVTSTRVAISVSPSGQASRTRGPVYARPLGPAVCDRRVLKAREGVRHGTRTGACRPRGGNGGGWSGFGTSVKKVSDLTRGNVLVVN
jgi:hypothetical protein